MKIALAVNGFPVASETFIYNQAAGLQAAGFEVTVVTSGDHGDPELFADRALQFSGAVRRAVIGGHPLVVARRTMTNLDASALRLLERAYQTYGVSPRALRAWLLALPLVGNDVIHLEYTGLAIAWMDALKLLRPARLFVSCRGTAERITPHTNTARASALRELFELVDRVHCVSEDIVRECELLGLDRAKAFVNRPAVDTEIFRRIAPIASHGPLRLISTGRLVWAKGLDFALPAIKRLVNEGHDIRYDIVGAGPEEDRLRFSIHDLRLAERVRITGKVSAEKVRELLERSDVFLLPSVSEGISNAALEAMAMELAVVASNVGGMPEAIRDGIDGLLVPSRDPLALSNAIERLARSRDLRVSLGTSARERVEREFSIKRQLEVFMAEYEASA